MNENYCRVLGAYSRPDLEIVLDRCKLTSAGASALSEVLEQNQGPTKFALCEIDSFVLANGLRGNSRLESLRPRLSSTPEDGNRKVLVIAYALKETKGLVVLLLIHDFRMSDETWGAVCDSLKTHPTLQVLNLSPFGMRPGMTALAPAVIKSRIQVLVDMLKLNTSIHAIGLHPRYSQHELFRESVIPYLKTNQFRPDLLAIQKTRPITYRAKVQGAETSTSCCSSRHK
jgi:hypothetical protein